jgi:two-component system CheB/CheR fusion protein
MQKAAADLQSLANQLLLQQYAPAAVLVNDKEDIIYLSGMTGKYLEQAAGKANWNIFAMGREGLRLKLSAAFQKATRQKGEVTIKGGRVENSAGPQGVDITAQTLEEPEALCWMMIIVFSDLASVAKAKHPNRGKTPAATNLRIADLEEELRSTNEELQSINAEQQAKIKNFSRLSAYMKNLLNSTEIATVFLDNDLNVKRFTTGVNKLFKLIPGDARRYEGGYRDTTLFGEAGHGRRQALV